MCDEIPICSILIVVHAIEAAQWYDDYLVVAGLVYRQETVWRAHVPCAGSGRTSIFFQPSHAILRLALQSLIIQTAALGAVRCAADHICDA